MDAGTGNKGKKAVTTPKKVKSTPVAGAAQAKVGKKAAGIKEKARAKKKKSAKGAKPKPNPNPKGPRDFSLESLQSQLRLGGLHKFRYAAKKKAPAAKTADLAEAEAAADAAAAPLTKRERGAQQRANKKDFQTAVSALYTELLPEITHDLMVVAFSRRQKGEVTEEGADEPDDDADDNKGVRVSKEDLDFVLGRHSHRLLVGTTGGEDAAEDAKNRKAKEKKVAAAAAAAAAAVKA
jgi:hypothetical protein